MVLIYTNLDLFCSQSLYPSCAILNIVLIVAQEYLVEVPSDDGANSSWYRKLKLSEWLMFFQCLVNRRSCEYLLSASLKEYDQVMFHVRERFEIPYRYPRGILEAFT